ncbi:MAG: hypothetical protein ACP5I3_10990 [Thermoproteus sp.]
MRAFKMYARASLIEAIAKEEIKGIDRFFQFWSSVRAPEDVKFKGEEVGLYGRTIEVKSHPSFYTYVLYFTRTGRFPDLWLPDAWFLMGSTEFPMVQINEIRSIYYGVIVKIPSIINVPPSYQAFVF